jgi:DEAD/DEAH box helicase domain-containing protein
MHDLLLERTQALINSCECPSGCPSCVGPEGNTGPYAKRVASLILLHLRSGEAVAGGAQALPDEEPF